MQASNSATMPPTKHRNSFDKAGPVAESFKAADASSEANHIPHEHTSEQINEAEEQSHP